jgi:hypothetical protein
LIIRPYLALDAARQLLHAFVATKIAETATAARIRYDLYLT